MLEEKKKSKAQELRERMSTNGQQSNGVVKCSIDDAHLFGEILERLIPVETGDPNKTGRIGIYVRHGKLQVVVSWPEACAYGFARAESFTGLMESLEEQLREGTIEWLKDKPTGAFKRS